MPCNLEKTSFFFSTLGNERVLSIWEYSRTFPAVLYFLQAESYFIFLKFIEILIGLDFIACTYLSFLFQESKQSFIFFFHSSIFQRIKVYWFSVNIEEQTTRYRVNMKLKLFWQEQIFYSKQHPNSMFKKTHVRKYRVTNMPVKCQATALLSLYIDHKVSGIIAYFYRSVSNRLPSSLKTKIVSYLSYHFWFLKVFGVVIWEHFQLKLLLPSVTAPFQWWF